MTVPDFQGESIGYNTHFGRSGSLMVSVRALQVLAGDMALLRSWARHLTLTVTVSLSTQVYKWEPANLMPGVALPRTSIPSRDLGEGVEIPLVTSCYRMWYKLWLDGSLGSVQAGSIYGVRYDWPNVSSVFFFGKSQTLSHLRCLLCKLEETNDPESFVTGWVLMGLWKQEMSGSKARMSRPSHAFIRYAFAIKPIFSDFSGSPFSHFVGRGEQGLWV